MQVSVASSSSSMRLMAAARCMPRCALANTSCVASPPCRALHSLQSQQHVCSLPRCILGNQRCRGELRSVHYICEDEHVCQKLLGQL